MGALLLVVAVAVVAAAVVVAAEVKINRAAVLNICRRCVDMGSDRIGSLCKADSSAERR